MSDRRLMLVHAHPDDECISTGVTMARYVAEGAGVTLVTCTAGEEGEILTPEIAHLAADQEDDLGPHRVAELAAAMKELGVTDHRFLGGTFRFRDSGMQWSPTGHAEPRDVTRPDTFWHADLVDAANELVALIREVRPQVLITYDEFGGYGHPDHVQVHRVGRRAAELARPDVVLEATVNRDPLVRLLKLAGRFYKFPPEFDVRTFESAYSSGETITHRVNVRKYARQKRASMAAHASQASGGDSDRTLAVMLKVPRPLYRLVFGTEWYVRRDLPSGTRLRHPFDRWPE